ncbi:PH domain-containing protein [Epidermidibacterium keratini]|uniref:PH domain-containing protein n=1 Tax=Epidermidibacterium keratini TaxID=1891644 RepID=A0A7L4YR10_9ACTN|nr:PH domain-containing protein [Epidermidibacterium keratini]QHC01586.1 PH domain-containing protein [Epidermidibacterium keratini]
MPRTARSQTTVVRGLGDPRQYLLRDERVVVAVRRHVLVLGAAVAETIGFIAAVVMLQFLLDYARWINTVAGLVMLAALLRMAYLVLEWRMERFVVTTQRMMLLSGVINRRIAAIPLRKVTDLTFDKPLVGQIFGYGTFVIESAGQDQAMSRIAYLPRANFLYIEVSDLLFGSGPDAVFESSLPIGVDPDDDRFAAQAPSRDYDPAQERQDYDEYAEADRQQTDPTLGQQLAGIDFSGPPPPATTAGSAISERRAPRWARR